MKNKIISLSIIFIFIFTSLISADAISQVPRIELDEYQIQVTDINNVYVSGTVSICKGQLVGVYDSSGIILYSYKELPNTGSSGSFTLQVPARQLKEGTTTFKVKSLPLNGVINGSNPKTLTVKVNSSKMDQTITANNLSLKVNETKNINAKVDSGLSLTYISSNPNIATVDAKGNVLGRSEGSTTIIISQPGNSKYSTASKTITVKVVSNSSTSNNTYTIAYHGGSTLGISPIKGTMSLQKVEVGKSVKLQPNKFSKNGYEFVGWATSNGIASKNGSSSVSKFSNINMDHFQLGKVSYKNGARVKNLAAKGETIHLYAVWKGCGPEAAVDWACIIANDNSFMYGTGKRAHKGGCYYCGTNITGGKKAKKGSKWEKTYCCNPFVAAAYVHGANIKSKCGRVNNHYFGGMETSTWTCYNKMKGHKGVFKQISKSSKLKPGDILTKSTHVWMYAGNGMKVEAAGGGFTKSSIRIKKGTSKGSAKRIIRYYPNN